MGGVSVVIPCHNASAFLPACLESALTQSHEGPLEVLVGDDGSTDGSAEIAERTGDRVRVLRHPGGGNRGVSATRNLCLRAARHPFVAFLDADDVWLPGHVRALSEALEAEPLVGFAYDNGRYLYPDGRSSGTRLPEGHRAVTAERLLLDCCLAPAAIMVRREVLDRVGLFDESLRYGEDNDLWLRILECWPAVFVPVMGWLYRQHPGQSSRRTREMWDQARKVVAKAEARGRYPRRLLRRRRAVLDFRLGQCDLRDRRWLSAGGRFLRAFGRDPLRAVRVLAGGITRGAAGFAARQERPRYPSGSKRL